MMFRSTKLAVLRGLDLVVIAMTAPVWVPIMAFCAALVRTTSGEPVLFRQDRIGLGEKPFSVMKFRSMNVGENPLIPDECETTAAGTFLRKWSLDELPQIVNVIRGEMSLVGPRPMLPRQSAFVPPHAQGRHSVRPGITGLAQVNGRNSITWDERFVYDAKWATRPTTLGYLAILMRTLRVVLLRDGVSGHDPTDPFVVDLSRTTDLRESTALLKERDHAL